MTTRLQLIQRAQARMGDEPIASEDAPGADTHIAIYETVLDELLSLYSWSFAMSTRRLTRLVATPERYYGYLYQLPAEMIGGPLGVYDREPLRAPFRDYEIGENRLATSAAAVWIRHLKRVDPTLWPGYFGSLFQMRLMSELALSVREDPELHASLDIQAFGKPEEQRRGGLFALAVMRDLEAQLPPDIYDRVAADLLSRYPWSFATKTAELTAVVGEAPELRYTTLFALPEDMCGGPRAVFDSDTVRRQFRDYWVDGGRLATSAQRVFVRYTHFGSSAAWPSYFKRLVEAAARAEAVGQALGQQERFEALSVVAFGSAEQKGRGGLYGQALEADIAVGIPAEVTDKIVDDMLARAPWSFAAKKVELVRVVGETPVAHWAHLYDLPADIVGEPRTLFASDVSREPFTSYEIVGRRIATSADKVWLRYTARVDRGLWPGHFAAIVDNLERAQMALELGDIDEHDRRMVMVFGAPEASGASGLLKEAREADMMASPPPEIEDRVVRDLLGRYPWQFASGVVELAQVVGVTPVAHWLHLYELPADRMDQPRAVYFDSARRVPTTDYEVIGDRLAANAAAVWVRYQRYVPRALWPRTFASLVDAATRAEVAQALGKSTLARALHDDVYGPPSMMGEGGLLGQAKNADAQTQPSPAIAEGRSPLIEARY